MNATDEIAVLLDRDRVESVVDSALATLTGQALDDARDFDLVSRTLTEALTTMAARALRGHETSDEVVMSIAAGIREDWESEVDDEIDDD